MNLILLAWKNIRHQWLDTLLGVLLLAFGLGTISMLILIEKQSSEQFNRNIKDIDMVLGAKGSPLQLILANVYHVDAPTGNIKIRDAKQVIYNPTVAMAIPLAYGDNFQQWRIVGTDSNYAQHYAMKLREGVAFKEEYDANIGADVAKATGLKLGDTFLSTHGLDQTENDEEHAHHHAYRVVGIFEKSGSVIDRLILTPVETIWHAHEDSEPASAEIEESNDSTNSPPPMIKKGPMMMLRPAKAMAPSPNDNKEVTAYLIKSRMAMAQMILPNLIKETNMQLAFTAIEVNRLSQNFGLGMDTVKAVAWVIIGLSFFSIFISLFNSLKKRKYELALMRSMGASPFKVFALIITESLLLVSTGIIFSWLFSRIGLSILSHQLNNSFHYTMNVNDFSIQEVYLTIAALLFGVIAALAPAINAYKMDISKTLAHE
jgi:putative ABC transport system permease protein